MGILDEAIREHLELKRQHGADDSELKQLEDDAFGPPGRPGGDAQPDPVAEAATEFMTQPDLGDGGGEAGVEPLDDERGAKGEIEAEAEVSDARGGRREPPAGLVDLQEAPEPPLEAEEEDGEEPKSEAKEKPEPAEEDHPAGEHEAVQEPISSTGPNTEERHAIAQQPTEMFDVAAHIGDEEEPATEEPAPADEELVAEEISEPRLAPPESEDVYEEEDDEFWSEQRLSDELDQALEAPPIDEPESVEHEVVEPESAEHEVVAHTDEHEIDDRTQVYETVREDTDEHEVEEAEEPRTEVRPAGDAEHDALEETPDFLEEAPEDDQLWFEQKPPKDFDFDD